MKIAERIHSGYLLLILALAVTVAFIFLGMSSFKAGSGYEWLLAALPVWLVIETFLIGGYFWERSKRGVPPKTRAIKDKFRVNWWLPFYVVACVVAASVTRAFFPAEHEVVYSSGYWALLGVSVLALFWLAVLSPPNAVYSRIARWVTTALLLLVGTASGPLIAMLANARGMMSPIVVIAGIAWISPVLLWGWRLYPFKAR